MAASNKQKLKLLNVYRMLMEETDVDHGLSMADILARLEAEGLTAERKSIYRDIEALRSAGIEVITYPRSPVEYAVVKGKASLSEVSMLMDVVQGSKFLTEGKSRALANTVKGLASKPQQATLVKRVHVEGRIKNQNDSVFHNVDTIHAAMQAKRKISFMYFKYGTDLERHPSRPEPYVHTAVKLVFSDGLYYLVTWSDNHQDFVTFRVDRMYLLQITDEPATRNARISNYDFEDFEYKAFGMFRGESRTVTLHATAAGMDVLVDKFGREGLRITGCDEEACDVHVPVVISTQFYGWLAGLHGIVDLVAPEQAVKDYRAWAKSLVDGSADEGAATASAAAEATAETAAEAAPAMDLPTTLLVSAAQQDRAAIVLCDLEHTIVYMNPAAIQRYAKRGGAALLGQSLMACHNPQSQEIIERVVAWFAASPQHNLVYESYNPKENKDVYMVALRDGEGRLIGYYEKHEYRNRETAPFYDMPG